MPDKDKWVIWENGEMSLQAAYNPAIPRIEGFHLVLLQKMGVASPWADPELYGRMSVVAARISRIIMQLKMADWINVHYDGNNGIAKGKPFLHIHIFGRYKTGPSWGGPLQLPSGEGPYGNRPLDQAEIKRLWEVFAGL